jgi:hypothetical protein
LSQESASKLLAKKLKKVELKTFDSSIVFEEKELASGGKIFYNLEMDTDEDLHILSFYFANSTTVYKFYISNFGYSFEGDNFFFMISNWVYDKSGNCKMIWYKVILKSQGNRPLFIIKKDSETICAG